MPDVSLSLTVRELINNPEIELPNSNEILSDNQFNYDTSYPHDNVGEII